MIHTAPRVTARCVLLLLLLAAFTPTPVRAADDGSDGRKRATVTRGDDAPVVAGVVLARFREDVAPAAGAAKTGVAALDELADAFGVFAVERTFPFLDAVAAKDGRSPAADRLRRVYTVRYGSPAHPLRVAEALARDPRVVWAEPRYVYRTFEPAATPSDTLYERQDHLRQVHLPEAWDVVKGGQGTVVVAVADGGTEWQHPDLRANVWTNPGETPDNNVDDDGNGYVDDVHGWNFQSGTNDPTGSPSLPGSARHGTAVAGVASAVTDNVTGIAGASWNATYMPLNVGCPTFDDQICYGYDGILYAAQQGAAVVNASWGGPVSTQFGQEVIEAAHEAGTLVVAAAGNASENIDISAQYPANYPRVLAVGATRKTTDDVASFSNYGRSVGVFAPGTTINATVSDGGYARVNGTSFSSPLTAGVAALVKTRFPAYTLDQIREQLRVTADPITAQNDTLAGRLGKGRINAFRAVTETGHPAVRLVDVAYTTSSGDTVIASGETVTITATLVNYLADAPDVRVRLGFDGRHVSDVSGTVSAGPLATGATTTVELAFEVAEDAPRARNLRLFAEIEAGDYRGTDVIRGLVANPAAVVDHTSGKLTVSITDEGNIGFLGFDDTEGSGFVYEGRSLLFEGGLLLGVDAEHVSDAVRNAEGEFPGSEQDHDLVPALGTVLEIVSPGEFTQEEGSVEITDAAAPEPLGLTLAQETFVDDEAAYDDFIVFKYTISNTRSTAISNLFAGLFFDWDIADAQENAAGFDASRRLGYVYDPATSTYAGTKLLTTDAELSYRAIDNADEEVGIYDGFSDQEKWDFLSGGVQTTTLSGPVDASQLMGAGPYVLDPGGAVVLGFALVAGDSPEALFEHADNAQLLWDAQLSGTDTPIDDPLPGTPSRFALEPVYPNPARPPATFAYALARPGDAALVVFDVLGREVQHLDLGERVAGTYEVTWDGLDAAGRRVPSGLYLVRYTAKADGEVFTQTRSVVVVR